MCLYVYIFAHMFRICVRARPGVPLPTHTNTHSTRRLCGMMGHTYAMRTRSPRSPIKLVLFHAVCVSRVHRAGMRGARCVLLKPPKTFIHIRSVCISVRVCAVRASRAFGPARRDARCVATNEVVVCTRKLARHSRTRVYPCKVFAYHCKLAFSFRTHTHTRDRVPGARTHSGNNTKTQHSAKKTRTDPRPEINAFYSLIRRLRGPQTAQSVCDLA